MLKLTVIFLDTQEREEELLHLVDFLSRLVFFKGSSSSPPSLSRTRFLPWSSSCPPSVSFAPFFASSSFSAFVRSSSKMR